MQNTLLSKKAKRLQRILATKNVLLVIEASKKPMLEQGSSSRFLPEDSDDNRTEDQTITVDQFHKQRESSPTYVEFKTPQKLPGTAQNPMVMITNLSPIMTKTKPKRMESENPDKKHSKKLRKTSIIKNSASLRNDQKNEKPRESVKLNNSESENELTSNRDYSEEQGRVFNIVSTNGKSNSNISKWEYKHCTPTKCTVSSMRTTSYKTAGKTNFYKKQFNTSSNSNESRWNSETKSIMNTVKPKKFKKVHRLQNIFKVYNRKDMIIKLNSLRQNGKTDKVKSSKLNSIDIGNKSYKDNEYDNSNTYLSKLENKTHKYNASMYNTNPRKNKFLGDMTEVDSHLEATPNASN
jgi:hypothetical protein